LCFYFFISPSPILLSWFISSKLISKLSKAAFAPSEEVELARSPLKLF
jgi:hypothetical protein